MSSAPKIDPPTSGAKEQLSHSIETFRFLFDLMAKVWAFLVAAIGIVLGFGIISKASGPIFLSALIMLVAALLPVAISRSAVPLAYSAYVAERMLQGNTLGVVQVFGSTVFRRLMDDFERIEALDGDLALAELQKLAKGKRFIGRSISVLLLLACLALIALGFYFVSKGAPLFDLSRVEALPTFSAPVDPQK